MSVAAISSVFVFTLLVLLAGGIWIFTSLFLSSGMALYFLADFPLARIIPIAKSVVWTTITSYQVAAVPLFIWMGEILFRTDLSLRLFRGLVPFVNRVPGRLLHTNVLGCTLFAAVSGSSVATTATVGRITTVELMKRNYDYSLSIGALAGSGGLGMMIPPSIVLVLYGLLAQESIAKLFVAGIMPGLLLAAMYMTYIVVISLLRPEVAPSDGNDGQAYTWRDYLFALGDLGPVVFLIVFVLGGIYTGIVTPSEAAAVGVLGAVITAAAMRQLTIKTFLESIRGTIKTSCMVLSLLVAASFLAAAMSFMHIPVTLAEYIAGLDLSPLALILVLGLFYLLLGMFIDGMSIIVITLPITLPLVIAAGFDPIWYGVFLVIVAELSVITPPVGFNLFVIQGLTGDGIHRVAIATIPFF
ncbi:MAG: TRAP transporter large permease subunit, partial [Rhodobacteraceae bacterium]|nr:TRAP transporter large permease subunit [Paracoccaceae bacterium]